MRTTFALLAGAVLLSGCTPNSLIEFLYPRCKQEHTSCADASRNQDPPWVTDTSHWSKPIIPVMPPIGDSAKIPQERTTTVVSNPVR